MCLALVKADHSETAIQTSNVTPWLLLCVGVGLLVVGLTETSCLSWGMMVR